MPVLKTTPPSLPLRLGKPPLVDALFEIRFEPSKGDISQLLPGLFYAKLGSDYTRSETLPLSGIPPEFRSQDRSLQYQYLWRLIGPSAAISVGDRCAGVSSLPPYQGWSSFLPRITAFLEVLRESALVTRLERYSLKFVNVLTVPTASQLDLVNLEILIGGNVPSPTGFHLRTEMNDENAVRIVEIIPHASVKVHSGDTKNGLLVSIDCIRAVTSGEFSELTPSAMERMHHDLKEVFFGLLKPATLQALEPTPPNIS